MADEKKTEEDRREKKRVYAATYRAANPEKVKAATTASRAKKPWKKPAADAAWRKANPERDAANHMAWDKANPDKVAASSTRWNLANREQKSAINAAWHAAHPDKRRIYNHNYRSALVGKLSFGLAGRLLELQRGTCPCCNQPLGEDYHMDHIMPRKLGGTNTDDNIQLLRQQCNNQKHAKHPVDFMRSRGFLL